MHQSRCAKHLSLVTADMPVPSGTPAVGILTLKPEARTAVMALNPQQRKRLLAILTNLRDALHTNNPHAEELKKEIKIILACSTNSNQAIR